MVLHGSFLHILQNVVFQMIIGSFFEIIVGPVRFLAVYILSGIGGVLMSALINDKISVGASTALFGIVGGLLAFLIVNWIAMENMKELRCCLMCFIIILILINVMFGLSDTKNIDNYGHLGGFVTGLPLAMALMPVLKTSMRRHEIRGWTFEKYCALFGAAAGFLWLGLGILLFYVDRSPVRACP
jgi:rhomboid protease GluP